MHARNQTRIFVDSATLAQGLNPARILRNVNKTGVFCLKTATKDKNANIKVYEQPFMVEPNTVSFTEHQ